MYVRVPRYFLTDCIVLSLQIKTEPAVRKRSTSTNVDTGSDYSDDLTTCLPDAEEEPLDCTLGYDQVTVIVLGDGAYRDMGFVTLAIWLISCSTYIPSKICLHTLTKQ